MLKNVRQDFMDQTVQRYALKELMEWTVNIFVVVRLKIVIMCLVVLQVRLQYLKKKFQSKIITRNKQSLINLH